MDIREIGWETWSGLIWLMIRVQWHALVEHLPENDSLHRIN
jgi:hypothetical protein